MAGEMAAQHGAQLYTSWARWAPRLDLQLSQSRSKDFSLVTSGALGALGATFEPREVPLARWSLNLTLPLYKRSVHLGVERSAAERALARAQLEDRLSELDWRLRSLLGKYLLQAYREATLQAALAIAKTNLREAKLRFELGQRTKVDVLRGESSLLSIESQMITQREQKAVDLAALIEYAGITEEEFRASGVDALLGSEAETAQAISRFAAIDRVSEPLLPLLKIGDTHGAELHREIERRIAAASPAYRNSLLQEELEFSNARALMAQEWPELALQGSLSKQGEHWNDAFSAGSQSRQIALVLNIPLFSFGTTVSTYLEKAHARNATAVRTAKEAQRLRSDAENAWVRIQALRKLLDSQTLQLSQNEEILRLSFKSYQLGKTTQLELLTSQNELTEAKLRLAQTKIDLSNLMRKFAWDLGIGL